MSSSHLALFSLQGKIAAVSGGTRGIGKAMAIALAEAGAGKELTSTFSITAMP